MSISRCGWLLAICIAATAQAVPDVLVVQGFVPKKGDTDANVVCSDILADEIYKGGKLNPILWSLGDPIFRAAIDDGLIKNPSSKPTLADALKVQRALKTEYIAWVEAYREGDQVKGKITLYKGNKALWSDSQQTGVLTQGKFDQIGTLRAICHSWATLSDTGPLQKLTSVTPIPTPPPDPGKLSPPVELPPVSTPATSNDTALFESANQLKKEGKIAKAVGVLRDGVDASPMDPERRKALAEMLLAAGEPVLAAQEARRAAQLFPDQTAFRMLAARAWLQAGNGDEAQTDLNELAAHQPTGGQDKILTAQALLFQFKVSPAIDLLDAQIATKPSGDAYFFRSIAKALQSDEKEATSDVQKVADKGDPLRYTTGMAILDNSVPKIADELRSLLDQASIKAPKELAEAVTFQTSRSTATRALLSAMKPDPGHEKSHERRVLAYNLLIQCLSDLKDFMDSHNDDTLSDARINLGEALKHFKGAKSDFLSESRGSADDRPAS